ncbi:hypothetical protein N5D61_08620 [Pseudomonas sp. GD03842]|uniref:hypothetical protein n=1 Tax=Pseudomonas sp. GD03842 TaxID=2975385 RepID=UPI00244D0BE0|nr:hypothetical protein [Pseudomonas sp. GD03842]MDH0746404.1 hypothetical protein [Pseudomonas sp. GD03842]
MSYTDDTQWISTFTLAVTSSSNKVFSNGRHQVEITVGVTPQEGEEVTEEQMASIQLVTLDDEGNYQGLSGDLQLGTERDERFDYHPDASASDITGLESTTQRRIFYVSSTRPEARQDTLYAVISKDDETRCVTHSSTFNASVTVESVAPTQVSADDFMFWGDAVPNPEPALAQASCEIYSLAFKDPARRIVASLPRGAGEGVAYYQNHLDISPWEDADEEASVPPRFQNFYHYAYKVGEPKAFVFQGSSLPLNQTPGVMNFVRLKTTSDRPEVEFHHDASRWALLDQYGNAHTIEMKQFNDGAGLDFALLEYM